MSPRPVGIVMDDLARAVPRMQAIIVREVRSRFTGDVLGYAWAYLTPLAWVGIIYFIFSFMGRRSPIDTDVLSFILSGVIPYIAFRFTITAVLRARTAYRHIMALSTVSPQLVYAAIAILELYNALAIYALFLAANYLIFGRFEMADPLLALLGFSLAWGSGAAFGYAAVRLSAISEVAARITPTLLRPLFYISAVFYTANEMPVSVVEWLAWNPLLHAIELTRSGLFLAYESHVASPWVPILFIGLALAVGISVSRIPMAGPVAEEQPS